MLQGMSLPETIGGQEETSPESKLSHNLLLQLSSSEAIIRCDAGLDGRLV